MRRVAQPYKLNLTTFFRYSARRRFQSPVAMLIPIVAQQFSGMLRTIRTIATLQIIHWAILITAPANAFGVFGVQWKFLDHE